MNTCTPRLLWFPPLLLLAALLFSCSIVSGKDTVDPERANINVVGSYIEGTWVCTNIPEEEGGPPKFKERLQFLRGSEMGQVLIDRSTDSPGDATKTDGYKPYPVDGHTPLQLRYEICRKGYSNTDSFYWIIHMPWEGAEVLTFGAHKRDIRGVLAVRREGPRFKGDYVRQ